MDFAVELRALTVQIPGGRVATCADLAAALGDSAATRAVLHLAREDGAIPNRHRIVTSDGRPVVPGSGAKLRAEGVALIGGSVVAEDARFRPPSFQTSPPLVALREEQLRLRRRVRFRDGFRQVRTIAGVDLAYADGFAIAAAVVCAFPDGTPIEASTVREPVRFPYIPGYLAYREAPAITECVETLDAKPDVLLIDGHGVLHPARFGLASLVGLRLGFPTIGCAKSPLVGRLSRMPAPRRSAPIVVDGDVLGRALRPGQSRRLVYVSVGHKVSLHSAVRIVRAVCRTSVPEPLRLAHRHATEIRKRITKRV